MIKWFESYKDCYSTGEKVFFIIVTILMLILYIYLFIVLCTALSYILKQTVTIPPSETFSGWCVNALIGIVSFMILRKL